MALTPGTRLGPYDVTNHIGAGGMGEVYKAKDTRLNRTVAVKVLPEHVAADPDSKHRFEREPSISPNHSPRVFRSTCVDALRTTSPLLFHFPFELEVVPVRGFAKGWCVKFEGIAA